MPPRRERRFLGERGVAPTSESLRGRSAGGFGPAGRQSLPASGSRECRPVESVVGRGGGPASFRCQRITTGGRCTRSGGLEGYGWPKIENDYPFATFRTSRAAPKGSPRGGCGSVWPEISGGLVAEILRTGRFSTRAQSTQSPSQNTPLNTADTGGVCLTRLPYRAEETTRNKRKPSICWVSWSWCPRQDLNLYDVTH